MQTLIPATILMKLMAIRFCVKMSKYFIFRKLGMYLGTHDRTSMKRGSQRLFLESYFDLAIGVFMNIIAFMQCKTVEEFLSFFATRDDFINSVITIILTVLIIYFPIWIFWNIYKNRDDLGNREF